MRVSHETIYTSLFVQAKAGLPGSSPCILRTRRVRRRAARYNATRIEETDPACPGPRPFLGGFVLAGSPGRREAA